MGRIVALSAALLPFILGAATSISNERPTGIFRIPQGYRDWPVIAVAREEGALDDLRATLGNPKAMTASREGKWPYPDGSIIARVAWSYEPLKESAQAFGRPQSYVAGVPKNGVQFMIKDSRRYGSTGGWGFSQINGGSPTVGIIDNACFACHALVSGRDFVFSRYAQ